MNTDLFLAIGHHLFAFVIFGAVVVEAVLLWLPLDENRMRRLVFADAVYGLAALGMVVIGVARLRWGVKPFGFYAASLSFWLKMGMGASAGLLSILPTYRYLTWWRQSQLPSTQEVRSTFRVVLVELLLLLGMPVCAALMARGVG